jgi:hypothetical protein
VTHYTGYLQRTCWLSTYVVGFPCGLVLQIKMQEHKRQEWRKGSNHWQAAPCSVNYNSQWLQGRHLADIG